MMDFDAELAAERVRHEQLREERGKALLAGRELDAARLAKEAAACRERIDDLALTSRAAAQAKEEADRKAAQAERERLVDEVAAADLALRQACRKFEQVAEQLARHAAEIEKQHGRIEAVSRHCPQLRLAVAGTSGRAGLVAGLRLYAAAPEIARSVGSVAQGPEHCERIVAGRSCAELLPDFLSLARADLGVAEPPEAA